MKMQKPREIFVADEETTLVVAAEEQTLVAPRFDDEETLVARPVVPLGEAESPTASAAAPSAFAYARGRRLLPRRRTLLALVLCSVLIGGVLGGAGLYLFQRQSGDARTSPTAVTTSQPESPNTAPNEASQPAPTSEAVTTTDAPPANAPTDTPPATDTPAAAETNASETNASNAPADEGRADADGTGAAHTREAESVPAADHGGTTGGTTGGTAKRGKKGERDEEIERSTRRANRAGSGAPIARADADAPQARRVDTIFYRPRRSAARDRARRQTAGDADRLRRIFEGTPE
jgi:hypothetical protein